MGPRPTPRPTFKSETLSLRLGRARLDGSLVPSNLHLTLISGLACHAAVTGLAVMVDGGWAGWCVRKAGSFAR